MSESYVFPPYRVDVAHDIDALRTRIEILDERKRGLFARKKAPVVLQVGALTVGFEAVVEEGRLFFQTANSDHEDAATLFCVHLDTGDVLWKVPGIPPSGAFGIDRRGRTMDVGKPHGTSDLFVVRVDFAGNTLHRNPASGYEMVSLGEGAWGRGERAEAVRWLTKALDTKISPNTKAKVLKTLGEIAEQGGSHARAMAFYEQAMELNPRIGVKRKLAELRGPRRQA